MELQVFDDRATPLFRLLQGEPLWGTFLQALREIYVCDFERDRDRELRLLLGQSGALVAALEDRLREGLVKALAQGKGEAGRPATMVGAVTVTVLGRALTLNLRLDEDLTLSRTNELALALRDAAESGRVVRMFIRPDMSRIANILAWTVQQQREPLTAGELSDRALRQLTDIRHHSTDRQTAREVAADSDFIQENGLNETLRSLVVAGLVIEEPPGSFLASEKLRIMRL